MKAAIGPASFETPRFRAAPQDEGRYRAIITKQNPTPRIDLADDVDLEIGDAVAIQITQDRRVVIAGLDVVDLVAELPGDAGEIAVADEAEGLVAGRVLVGIDQRNVDLVALGVAEVENGV